MPRRRLWLLRGIALLFSAGLALACAEVGVRIWQSRKRTAAKVEVQSDANGRFPGYDTPGRRYESQENFPPMVFDAVTCYRPKPGHLGHGATINRQGFRYPVDLDETPSENTFRVFVLGGSFAYGAGCPDEVTYFRVTENRLREQFPDRKIEVISAAGGAFSSLQEHLTLITRVARYRPNLVIFLTGANDAYLSTKGLSVLDGNDYLSYGAAIQGCIDGNVLPRYYYGQVFRDPKHPFPPLYEDYTVKTQWLIEKAAYTAMGRDQPLATITPATADETAERFLYVQQLNTAWGELQRVPTMVWLQPTISTITKPLHPAEARIQAEHTPEFHDQLRNVYAAIRKRWNTQPQVAFIDGNEIIATMPESECFFVDWVHAGEIGQRVVGNHLAELIAERINTVNLSPEK